MNIYIDGDTLEDARDAYLHGVPIGFIAARLGTSADKLIDQLGVPRRSSVPELDQEIDLFATDRLEAVL
jgi:hypothetical protein